MPAGVSNPGSGGENDFSDVKLTTPDYAEVSPKQLPIRGEKRVISSTNDISSVAAGVSQGISGNGLDPTAQTNAVDADSFMITAALRPFVDYIVVRMPHRGFSNGQADSSQSGVYRFLINPAQVQVNHNTVDAQSMTRAGWNFGVWGDDATMITLTGKTAGQYFALGTSDLFQVYTKSYRNLQQLEMVYENNGYWFEGEEAGEGPLASDFTRRRIKMHQDVELVCGNFIWFGMFDSLTVSQDAENPFLSSFVISFIAWKERFRTGSPYRDSIHNDVQRGHSYGSYHNKGDQQKNAQQVNTLPQGPSVSSSPPLGPTSLTAPAVSTEAAARNFFTVDTNAFDQTPMADVFFPNSPFSIFSGGH